MPFWKLFEDINEKTLDKLTWEICDQTKFLMKRYYTKELLRNEHYLWIKIIKNNVMDITILSILKSLWLLNNLKRW